MGTRIRLKFVRYKNAVIAEQLEMRDGLCGAMFVCGDEASNCSIISGTKFKLCGNLFKLNVACQDGDKFLSAYTYKTETEAKNAVDAFARTIHVFNTGHQGTGITGEETYKDVQITYAE